ncbi:unnamed protein product, partial [Meganyctiphanes norvegica]
MRETAEQKILVTQLLARLAVAPEGGGGGPAGLAAHTVAQIRKDKTSSEPVRKWLEKHEMEYHNLRKQEKLLSAGVFSSRAWMMRFGYKAIFGKNGGHLNLKLRKRVETGVGERMVKVVLDAGTPLLVLLLQRKELLLVHRPTQLHLHLMVLQQGVVEIFRFMVLQSLLVLHLLLLLLHPLLHLAAVAHSGCWIVMLVEAIIVLCLRKHYFRITRCLRPIFFLDSKYTGGVRRFLRQILQSVPPILEVLVILLFNLVIFSTLGFYIFSHETNPYFEHFSDAFVNLYVLLTTANFPDVMMPAYNKSKWSAAFFIAFLAINLYFVMNLMLAVVFVVFSDLEKDKFRKLLLHKRRACQLAFRLLVTRSHPNHIPYRHFYGLMKFLKVLPVSQRDVYLVFKALNKSGTNMLTLDEFYNIYEICEFSWRRSQPPFPWFHDLPACLKGTGYLVRKLVLWKWFDFFIYFVIVVNAFVLLFQTICISMKIRDMATMQEVTWDQIAFVTFYCAEAILKMIGLGLTRYFRSGWNIYDFLVTILAVSGIIASHFSHPFFFVVILRPLRLLRLFRMRPRYREVFQTFVILLPRIISAIIVIITTYYFFAIIGMEVFYKIDMKNCCINTTVEQYYKYDNESVYLDYYYLNNFDDIFIAGVTLFELTVVNNWFIIMEGYVSVTSDWARLYFMLFYLVMMIVMSVVVAFILEAFTFRMQYNRTVREQTKDKYIHMFVCMYTPREGTRTCQSTGTNISAVAYYVASCRRLSTQG